MTREELASLTKEDLICLVLQLHEQVNSLLPKAQEVVELRQRLAQLEAELPKGKPPKGKGKAHRFKPNVPKPEEAAKKPRKKRDRGFGRQRQEPTHRVRHVAEQCPDCDCRLKGGWVKRRRQVLHVPVVQVQVIEHEIVARDCPQCGREVVPEVDLSGEVLGQHQVSIGTMSLVATMREVGRLPLRTIQWYLAALCGLKLSLGEIFGILSAVAEQGKTLLERMKEEVRASPVVNGDETGWREDGKNGYIWTFSTPQMRYFIYRHSRSGTVVNEVLGEEFEGCLVTDFYAGYNRMTGLHQRCWSHLLRDIHDLREEHPEDEQLRRWAQQVNALYRRAKKLRPPASERVKAQHRYERMLSRLCEPHVKTDAPQRTLCERIIKYLPELFSFVADPRIPSDNNAAERSLRPLVIARKISGGTRSDRGSEVKMALASLFGTWLVRGLNPFEACRRLLLPAES